MTEFSEFGPVPHDAEFRRIRDLPTRLWTAEQALACAEWMTPRLLNANGLAALQRCQALPDGVRQKEIAKQQLMLRPRQAVALYEIWQMRGFFGSLPVGFGKTLVSFLIPLLFPGVAPVVLLVPGGLKASGTKKRGKTEIDFAKLERVWQHPTPINLLGFEFLALEHNAGYLCGCEACRGKDFDPKAPPGLRPKIIIVDESDMLKNAKAGRTRRVMRYMENHPDTVFVAFTGTMQRKSIDDYAHVMIMALREKAPVPIPWDVRDAWKSALDYSPQVRRHPGAILELPGVFEGGPYEAACRKFALRQTTTPGVMIETEQSCDQPIHIRLVKPPDDPLIEEAFLQFRMRNKTPCGFDVSDNFGRARVGQQMSSGFYTVPVPPPPKPWSEARRNYHAALRKAIETSERRGRPLDTEQQARNALRNHEDVIRWDEVEPTFEYKSEARWISMSAMHWAVEWMRANGPALVWVKDIPVGEMLSALSGVPYYGEGGYDQRGRLLDDLAEESIMLGGARESAIVSVGANMRGRNLWAWNRALVISPPQSETEWEQAVLGRIHRQGQTRPVYCDVLISSADSLYCLEEACKTARSIEIRQGFKQKLLLAEWDWSAFPLVDLLNLPEDDMRRPRWRREHSSLEG